MVIGEDVGVLQCAVCYRVEGEEEQVSHSQLYLLIRVVDLACAALTSDQGKLDASQDGIDVKVG